MKKTFLDLVFLQNSILKGIICTLLALFTGCARKTNKDDNRYEIIRESFVPKGLPSKGDHLFAFVSDSVGYAATNNYGTKTYVISKTTDSGKIWKRMYRVSGQCRILKTYKDKVYYASEQEKTSYSESEIGFIGTYKNNTILSKMQGVVYCMSMLNDSTISYAVDFHTHARIQDTGDISDSIFISYDRGKHWRKLNENFRILPVLGYDSSYVCFKAKIDNKFQWVVSDLQSEDTDIYDYGNTFNVQVDDGILANYTKFYTYRDGKLKQISRFVWTEERLFFSYGSCNTEFLAKNGEIVIAFALQFPGKEGEERCIFYSTDEGINWKPIVIGKEAFWSWSGQIPASKIPGKEGLTVIYQNNKDSLQRITIRRRDL